MIEYQIALTLIPQIGDITGKKLVSYCSGVQRIFTDKERELLKIRGIGKSFVTSIIANRQEALAKAQNELAFLEKYKIKPLFYLEKDYPERLKHCVDSPMMLYYKGTALLNAPKVLGIVGTRNATSYGKAVCNQIINGFKGQNVLIVSGLAFGIDTCSHKAALDCGLETLAVLGHGLDPIYPSQNKSLAERMIRQGGLITEFQSGTNPDRENFPRRNRIIAGLADAILVVEAAAKGGALITADLANSYDRDVFAIPGRIGDPYSEGCNLLIKNNKAALVQSAEDINYLMGWEKETKSSMHRQREIYLHLSPEEEKILAMLREKGETGIDALVNDTELTHGKVASALLNLEFHGIVRSLPGKVYGLY